MTITIKEIEEDLNKIKNDLNIGENNIELTRQEKASKIREILELIPERVSFRTVNKLENGRKEIDAKEMLNIYFTEELSLKDLIHSTGTEKKSIEVLYFIEYFTKIVQMLSNKKNSGPYSAENFGKKESSKKGNLLDEKF